MNFSTDRDLLIIEPNVFSDVPLAAQQRVKVVDGVIAGTILTSISADFTAAQVDSGGVVLVAGVAHEVISRTDANTLVISLPRGSSADPAIPSGDGSGLEIVVRSYAPQASVVHDALMRLIGIDLDDPENKLTEDSIVSAGVIARLEALGTLERVYSAAAALVGDNEEIRRKARGYCSRFKSACRGATVLLDLDGDGFADVRRSLGVVWFSRV